MTFLLFSKNGIFPFLRNGLAHKIVDSTNRLFVERWLSRVSMIICYDAQRFMTHSVAPIEYRRASLNCLPLAAMHEIFSLLLRMPLRN